MVRDMIPMVPIVLVDVMVREEVTETLAHAMTVVIVSDYDDDVQVMVLVYVVAVVNVNVSDLCPWLLRTLVVGVMAQLRMT